MPSRPPMPSPPERAPARAQSLFSYAEIFNQPLDSWDTSSATSFYVRVDDPPPPRACIPCPAPCPSRAPRAPLMPPPPVCAQTMFKAARKFNQPIGNWDVSKSTTMRVRLHTSHPARRRPRRSPRCRAPHPALAAPPRVVPSRAPRAPLPPLLMRAQEMFNAAADFNQPIGNWDVSKSTNMHVRLHTSHPARRRPRRSQCRAPHPALAAPPHVVPSRAPRAPLPPPLMRAQRMFLDAADFNQPIGNWDVSKVTNFFQIFRSAQKFNQPLYWDVSSGTDLRVSHRPPPPTEPQPPACSRAHRCGATRAEDVRNYAVPQRLQQEADPLDSLAHEREL